MDLILKEEILQLNPWLGSKKRQITEKEKIISRSQLLELMDPEWDSVWTLLIGPRRAGKTTLGKLLSEKLLEAGRFQELLYLNCDYLSIRQWLKSPTFISEAMEVFSLKHPILFIDEVQRIENPGLLLKAVIDLKLPIKHLATGSSQLEIKSQVQEHLTGRSLAAEILPLSHEEWKEVSSLEEVLTYGCYPQVLTSQKKELQLREIYQRYIQKDIIEILKVGNPDIFRSLISLLAHANGQLVNINQLATDCKVSTTMIRNYLDILEQTFVIKKVSPFVGNKRSEITKSPICYFIDNGFRNTALRNFAPPSSRTDLGLLVENFFYQELYKFQGQNFLSFDIHFWRTKSGSEVDFVLYKNAESLLPIEVKYQRFDRLTVTKGFRSFIEAYQPKRALMITKETLGSIEVSGCRVEFFPLSELSEIFEKIGEVMK